MISVGNQAIARKRVLIVEDDPLSMKMVSAIIAAQGYHVLQAMDGARGLELALREHPDLIITDVQMPGISGLEVSRRLKADEATRDIPVIVTTAYVLDERRSARADVMASWRSPSTSRSSWNSSRR